MEERARGAVAPTDVGGVTEQDATLRVGIVGAGFVGRIHARSARLAGASIAGVVASSPERSAAAAAELGAAEAFASAEELIASDGIDVVHICTPNHLHVPLTLEALDAGKHVVCEKPVALDAHSAERLVEAATGSGMIATVPFAYRYYPTVREARARVRRGATGPVRLLQGGYLQDWLLLPEDDNWRVDTELGGASRAFADIGSHWCDLVEFVSGQRITSLTARTAIAHPKRRTGAGHSFERGDEGGAALREVETEDMATVLFETDTGASGSVVISQVSAGRKNRLWFELAGEHETLGFDGEQPETLWVGTRNGATVIPRDPDGLDPSAAAYATLPAGHPQGYNDLFDAFVAETYAAIGGEAPADGLPTLADGLRAALVTDAVLESARTRGWVEVPA
jgi:predicted dehydrogenase